MICGCCDEVEEVESCIDRSLISTLACDQACACFMYYLISTIRLFKIYFVILKNKQTGTYAIYLSYLHECLGRLIADCRFGVVFVTEGKC